jgi:hypothetical protein
MPLYVWNIHPAESADPAVFGNAGVICVTCTRRVDAYVAKLAKAEKVGVLGYGVSENSKQSAGATRDSIEKYSDDIGGTEVAYFNDNIAFGMPNGIGPEVTAMKEAGVDMVLASVDLNGMKTLAQELERQGMADVKMVHPNTYDQAFVKEALSKGHTLRALIRDPARAPVGDDRISWVGGDARYQDDVRRLIAGADAVVSALGPTSADPTGGATSFIEPRLQDELHNAGRKDHKSYAEVRARWMRRGEVPMGMVGRFEFWKRKPVGAVA